MREYSPPKYPFASSGKIWFALVPVCSIDWTGHELQTWKSTMASLVGAGNFRTDPWTTPWHSQGTKRQIQLALFPDKCSVRYTLLPPRPATLTLIWLSIPSHTSCAVKLSRKSGIWNYFSLLVRIRRFWEKSWSKISWIDTVHPP